MSSDIGILDKSCCGGDRVIFRGILIASVEHTVLEACPTAMPLLWTRLRRRKRRRDYIQEYVFEFRGNLWYGERHKGTGWISIICLSSSDGAEDNTSNLKCCIARKEYIMTQVWCMHFHFIIHSPAANPQPSRQSFHPLCAADSSTRTQCRPAAESAHPRIRTAVSPSFAARGTSSSAC